MGDTGWQIELALTEVPGDQASGLAAELREFILDEDPDLQITPFRSDPEAQDLGASLLLVLASPAVVALARGIAKWIGKRSAAGVVVRNGDRTMEVSGIRGSDATKLAEQVLLFLDDDQEH
jgi:hypothetical protein